MKVLFLGDKAQLLWLGNVDRRQAVYRGTGIPVELADRFRDALEAAGVEHEVVVYEGAPHSFFDRKAAEFAAEAEDSWNRVLAFLSANA